jgi:hypothetical protein
MTKRKTTAAANEGIQADSVNAEVIAVGRNARAVQNRYGGDALTRAALDALVAQLNQALGQVPAERQTDADAVAELAQDVIDKAVGEKPNRKTLELKAESLKKAAEGLAGVAPSVLAIATQIVSHILKLGG